MGKFILGLLALLVIIAAGSIISERFYLSASQVQYGVTFSPRYAKYLKLDWQQVFIEILDKTGAKKLRLPGYWEDIEPQKDNFNFSDLDFMLAKAEEKGAKAIVVVGVKQPRWPECHIPVWAKSLKLEDRRQKVLGLIQKIVERYKDNPAVWAWQIENEPFLPFGEDCDSPDKSFLKKEVNLVRSLSNKDIIMTDSGELGFWATSMSLSDIFGTTLYRQVYDRFLDYVTYPLPPSFYSIKSSFIRNIFARSNKKTIIVELQAEPWLANGASLSSDQQAKLFPAEKLKSNIIFSKKTGFDEVYLWGVEWWYFMAGSGHPEYLNYAKTLFK